MRNSNQSLRRAANLVALTSVLWLGVAAHAFDAQGHRGARGLAPENTLAAFERALSVGVDTLELDIAITADGVAVITHDPALNPATTRDASGAWLITTGPLIHSLTLAQLQAYDVGRIDAASSYGKGFAGQTPRDGERVPTLAALFEWVKARAANDVRFNIELKTSPDKPRETASPQVFADTVLAVVRAAGMEERVSIQSFDWRGLALVQKAAPRMRTVYLTVQNARNDNTRDGGWANGMLWRDYAGAAHMVKAAGGAVWSPNFAALDAARVKEAQALGLQVIPWTVNDPADMQRLIEWGVDGIISDYPDRLRELMRSRGMQLPAVR